MPPLSPYCTYVHICVCRFVYRLCIRICMYICRYMYIHMYVGMYIYYYTGKWKGKISTMLGIVFGFGGSWLHDWLHSWSSWKNEVFLAVKAVPDPIHFYRLIIIQFLRTFDWVVTFHRFTGSSHMWRPFVILDALYILLSQPCFSSLCYQINCQWM